MLAFFLSPNSDLPPRPPTELVTTTRKTALGRSRMVQKLVEAGPCFWDAGGYTVRRSQA